MRENLVTVFVNGERIAIPEGSMVSAALLTVEAPCRRSVSGEPRTALCGMGICFECCALVDGVAQTRTCQMICHEGMRVETQP